MTGPKCASLYGATAIRTTMWRVTVMVHVVPRRFFSGQENSIRFNRRRFWLYSQGYFLTSYLMYNSGRFLLCNGASKELWYYPQPQTSLVWPPYLLSRGFLFVSIFCLFTKNASWYQLFIDPCCLWHAFVRKATRFYLRFVNKRVIDTFRFCSFIVNIWTMLVGHLFFL